MRLNRTVSRALALAFLLLPTLLRSAVVTYTTDNSDFANPERGFSVSDYYWGPGNSGNESLSSTNLQSDIQNEATPGFETHITIIRRLYVLSQYTGSALPTSVLQQFNTDCANARSMGVKIVPRFCYNWATRSPSRTRTTPGFRPSCAATGTARWNPARSASSTAT